jgi:hypothetical protein
MQSCCSSSKVVCAGEVAKSIPFDGSRHRVDEQAGASHRDSGLQHAILLLELEGRLRRRGCEIDPL